MVILRSFLCYMSIQPQLTNWFPSLIWFYWSFHLSLAYLHMTVYKMGNGMNSPVHYWATLSKGKGVNHLWSSKQLLVCSPALTITSVIQLSNFNSCWNYVESNTVERISLGVLSLLAFNSTRNAVGSPSLQDPLFLFSMTLQLCVKVLLMKESALSLSGLLLSWEWWNDYSFFLGLSGLQ